MQKKKILFVIPEYSHGGTNKSLENLLHFIDKDRYDVSIYSLYEDGVDFYKKIFAPYVVNKSLLYSLAHDNKVTRKVMGFLMRLSRKINFDWLYKIELERIQKEYEFDTIIAYQEGIVTKAVSYIGNCENKIAWIHFDYAMITDKQKLRKGKRFYDEYGKIICVSKAALSSMLEVYPEYRNKSYYIYNTIEPSGIRLLANEKRILPCYKNNVFKILSVGRLVEIKRYHFIPQIVSELKKLTTIPFCWYIIGDGEMREIIEHEISKYHLEEYVKLLGAQDNPYPYFKLANLHVCTSVCESFSYTIAESKILNTPVLCTDFPVASEVIDKNTGWICSFEDLTSMIADIIQDVNKQYTKKIEDIKTFIYNNIEIVKKFEKII